MNDFEAAVAYILPCDPVAKNKAVMASGAKRSNAEISSAEEVEVEVAATDVDGVHDVSVGGDDDSDDQKPAVGKIGVQFRYHKPDEYYELSDD